MRIVIDMQGAQAENSRRGIGRYTLSIVKAIVRQRGGHEIILVLNGLFSDMVEALRAAFIGLLPQSQIRVWEAPAPTAAIYPENDWRRQVAELTYEAFLASQEPDFIYITSLFEGLIDDAIISIHRLQDKVPVAVTLYDLIPYINPALYLENPEVKSWYLEKIEHLKRADLWLGISESSRQEGIVHLGLSEERSINISTDADDAFRPINVSVQHEQALRVRYGLSQPFVMYTGGIDHRKNIEGLIRAYALLPEAVRRDHQLAIICAVQPASKQALELLARQQGLAPQEIVLTGFVPDDDLLALYNLCKLFVFPSWHEGFGLPALEAMRCGAPVLGANTSSLPEVIGWEEALFDPRSDEAMAQAMRRGLTDEVFREALVHHGLQQAKKFSWDESARRALLVMEQWHDRRQSAEALPVAEMPRRKLAYVSPLPPARSGIADYSAELLPELAKFYDIEVIVDQKEAVTDTWVLANAPVRSTQWFVENADRFDRILYHFGNSEFHQHMFGLLEKLPGAVVLHDFFLSGIQAHRDVLGRAPNAWAQALYASHGYEAVYDRFTAHDTAEVVWRYPANLLVLQRALGAIVHSAYSRSLAQHWYGGHTSENWPVIPLLRARATVTDRLAVRQSLGLASDDLVVCSFGMLGPSKLNHRLLQAWLSSPLAKDVKAHLVFVGENHGGEYGQTLLNLIATSGAAKRIKVTGWAGADTFRDYLAAADIAVQLRTLSRGETSAAVLDCMNYGLPTIVNSHGSMGDLDPEGVWMLPDEFEDLELATALTTLAQDPQRRAQIGKRAEEIVHTRHAPKECAQLYFEAIEAIYQRAQAGVLGLCSSLASAGLSETECAPLSLNLARSFPPYLRRPQLLVDISELVQRDAKSGIQRVVRAVLREWITNPPKGYQVEPVYASADTLGYRYARRFSSQFLGIPQDWIEDEPIDAWNGDWFIGLDLQPEVVPYQQNYLKNLKARGIQIWFVVYDLLPILLPECFPPIGKELHTRWLSVVSEFDGLVCISQAVAKELHEWLATNGSTRQRLPSVEWFHLGADVLASVPSLGTQPEELSALNKIREDPSFLMVGTIEPRKGHDQVLEAFEELWRSDIRCNLIIVGKQGWMVESLVDRLRCHSQSGKRLFCFENGSDEFLKMLYAASTCLIAASYGEGFGLPLIEAAQHKLPIIARNIPVFREVAGDSAFYFTGNQPDDLSDVIYEWLEIYVGGAYPRSDGMSWLAWQQSAAQLLGKILPEKRIA